jgi:hypothetical protein
MKRIVTGAGLVPARFGSHPTLKVGSRLLAHWYVSGGRGNTAFSRKVGSPLPSNDKPASCQTKLAISAITLVGISGSFMFSTPSVGGGCDTPSYALLPIIYPIDF